MPLRFIIGWLCTVIAIIGVFHTGRGNAQSTGNAVCWSQLGNVMYSPRPRDRFVVVDMTANGQTVVLSGRYGDRYGATIIQVKKYNATSSKWEQIGSNIKVQGQVAISADGSTIIVTEEADSAQIVVYKFINADWVQVGSRIISNGAASPDVKISADGTVIAITSSDDSYVRVFKLNTSPFRWVQLGSEITDDERWEGTYISLSKNGTTIAIAHPYSNAPQLPQGIVRLYKYNSSTSRWVQLGNSILAGTSGKMLIGPLAMSRDGTMVAFSVRRPNFSGLVRVYKYNPSNSRWVQLGLDVYSGLRSDEDLFGRAVALSADGSTLVVGAPYTDGQITDKDFDSGRVFVFKFSSSTSSWQRHGHNINGLSSDDLFGYAVATSSDGKTIVIAAPGKDNSYLRGDARVYKETPCDAGNGTGNSTGPSIAGRWNLVGNEVNGTTVTEQLGSQVDISSDGRIIAAAFGRHPNNAGTRIMRLNARERIWEQIGSDLQGETVFSMSADGTTVLVRDYILGNYDKDYTIDATEFRVYRYISNDWVQIGSTFRIEYFWGSSAISGDGKTIFIGFDDTVCGQIYKLYSSPFRWVQIESVCRAVPTFSANGTIFAIRNGFGGSVQVYKLSGTPIRKIQLGSNVTDSLPYDSFMALSDDGTTIAVTTSVVRLYKLNAVSSRWIRFGADLPVVGNIAMSGDFTTIAMGNPYYDGIGFAPSTTNRDIGQVHIYKHFSNVSTALWRQLGPSIDGTSIRGYFGLSVALTQHGTTLIVGGTAQGENTYANGAVRVYKFTPTATAT